MKPPIHVLAVLVSVLVLLAPAASAFAQSYPSRPVRVLVPFPAGGGADVVARTITQRLADRWGQPVTVDNRAGGNTVIAAEAAARAAPDGYTLLWAMDTTLTQNPFLFSKLPYDPARDFAPITQAVASAAAVIVGESFKGSLADWVAVARREPGRVQYGVSGVSTQLAAALFERAAGFRGTPVAYKGSAPTAQGLLAGDVELVVDGVVPYLPHVKSGRLKVLATTGAQRSGALPDVPTLQELGYKDVDARVWFGFVAPRGTPRELVDRLHRDIAAVLAEPEVRARLAGFAFDVVASTPEQFASTIEAETRRVGPLIRELGLKLD